MGCHIIARIIVFVLNFAFWAAGILLITFGSIALADPDLIVDMLNLINGVQNVTGVIPIVDLLMGMAIFMIILGCFLFLLGGNGCHGAWRKSKRSIMMYMVWLLVSILVEIAIIVYGCVYPGTTETWIQQQMQLSLNTSFKPVGVETETGLIIYAAENEVAYNWQHLQFETKCCGGADYKDFKVLNRTGWKFEYPSGTIYKSPDIPPSCCVTSTPEGQTVTSFTSINDPVGCLDTTNPPKDGSYYAEGCWTTAYDMLWQFNMISVILASILIGAHLLALLFSVPLWKGGDDNNV